MLIFLFVQIRIIDKSGPLANFADRDHTIQYMVAVPRELRGPGQNEAETDSAPISTHSHLRSIDH